MGLKKWFSQNWVDIGSKKADGTFAKCGRSKLKADKKRKYPKCVPLAKARRMSESQRRSAVKRKRAKAQGVGGKPTNVKTFADNGKFIVKPRKKFSLKPKFDFSEVNLGDVKQSFKRPAVELKTKNKKLPDVSVELFKEYTDVKTPFYEDKKQSKGVVGKIGGKYGRVRGQIAKDNKTGKISRQLSIEGSFDFAKGGFAKNYYKDIL
jgi:hypothetical protein|tara:strand:- start:317 stop:937 length:621 start_codon:yes stop_codon:yes gene_type:complete